MRRIACQSGAWRRPSPRFNWRFSAGYDYATAQCSPNEQILSGSCGTDLSRPLDTAGIDFGNNAYACGDWGSSAYIYVGALCMIKCCQSGVWNTQEQARALFGGSFLAVGHTSWSTPSTMAMLATLSPPGCGVVNLITGLCNCPTGYSPRKTSSGYGYYAAAWDTLYHGYVCEAYR